MNIHDVNRGIHKHRSRKRIGRGPGSGHGKTSGKGHKGQTALPGYKALSIFEGGASPLVRRIPKRGFTNIFAPIVATINVGDLEQLFEVGEEVNEETLRSKGLVKTRFDELKILGDGDCSKKLQVSAHRFSQSAKMKIEQAGGTAVVLPGKKPVVKNKMSSARSSARK